MPDLIQRRSSAPPEDLHGHCLVCRARLHRPFALCYCCQVSVRQLQMPLVPVVTLVDYRLGDHAHRQLRGYKDASVSEIRLRYQRQLAEVVVRWMHDRDHGEWSPLDGTWDVVVPVPSSHRPAGAPVEAVLRHIPHLADSVEHLLVRGSAPTGHLLSDRLGFRLAPGADRVRLRALKVLVFDDSLVTGARAQSAAAALRLAGSQVVGVLAIGRSVGGVEHPVAS